MLLETDTCCSESNQPERVVQGEVIFLPFSGYRQDWRWHRFAHVPEGVLHCTQINTVLWLKDGRVWDEECVISFKVRTVPIAFLDATLLA